MQINSGMIKLAAGATITVTGIILNKSDTKCIGSGLIGFGLASMLLGSVDICCQCGMQENSTFKKYINAIKPES